MQPSWKALIQEIVAQLPPEFSLRDVLKHEDDLARFYPANKHIAAKIRQTLQILRDQGSIAFEGDGRYTKRNAAPRYSPIIDFSVGETLTSRAQIARQVLETWAELNLFCFACDADALTRLSANTPVADFACAKCAARYQLKGKNGRFGGIIAGAAYRPLVDAIRAGACPHHVLVEYDQRYSTVVFGTAIAGSLITEDRIIARKALAESARRAGWIGCSVVIEGLPSVALVEPTSRDPSKVRDDWQRMRGCAYDSEFERQMEMAERIMKKRRMVVRELA